MNACPGVQSADVIGAAVQILNTSAEATAPDIEAGGRYLKTEGEFDLRGTLGVAKDALAGFRHIRLSIVLDIDVLLGIRMSAAAGSGTVLTLACGLRIDPDEMPPDRTRRSS